MFHVSTARRQVDRSAARSERTGRCMLVENLEGRQLLSAFHRHPSVAPPGVVASVAAPPVAEAPDGHAKFLGTYTVRFYDYN